jgi:hypothetical protein
VNTGPFSIFALVVLVFAFLVWTITKGDTSTPWFKVLVFLCLFAGLVAFGAVVIKLVSAPSTPPLTPIRPLTADSVITPQDRTPTPAESATSPSTKPTQIPPPKHLWADQTTVYATREWGENPHITIPSEYDGRPLRKVRLTAKGSWTGDANSHRYVGPEGGANPAGPPAVYAGINEWCLLIKAESPGRSDVRYLPTKDSHIDFATPCQLSFRINDGPKLLDNAGSLDVYLTEVDE